MWTRPSTGPWSACHGWAPLGSRRPRPRLQRGPLGAGPRVKAWTASQSASCDPPGCHQRKQSQLRSRSRCVLSINAGEKLSKGEWLQVA
eukprot:357318-Chlamydomonas_euryale.AAC.1